MQTEKWGPENLFTLVKLYVFLSRLTLTIEGVKNSTKNVHKNALKSIISTSKLTAHFFQKCTHYSSSSFTFRNQSQKVLHFRILAVFIYHQMSRSILTRIHQVSSFLTLTLILDNRFWAGELNFSRGRLLLKYTNFLGLTEIWINSISVAGQFFIGLKKGGIEQFPISIIYFFLISIDI